MFELNKKHKIIFIIIFGLVSVSLIMASLLPIFFY